MNSYRTVFATIILIASLYHCDPANAAACCAAKGGTTPAISIVPPPGATENAAKGENQGAIANFPPKPALESVRLDRAQLFAQEQFHAALPRNWSALWWRNLRHPSFCNMVLCHGACAWKGDAGYSACSLVPIFPVLHEDGTLKAPVCGADGMGG